MNHERSQPRLSWLVTLVVVLLVAVGTLAIVVLAGASRGTTASLDMRGKPITLDPGTAPSASVVSRMRVSPDTGDRFVVPAVDLDVPLGALNAVDHAITPPGFTSAYAVRNMGTSLTSPQKGTVYVVAHSVRGGGLAPGNYLADLKTGASRVATGAVIHVGSVTYLVDSWTIVPKSELAADTTVWSNIPDRLVVITCLERLNGSPSTDNLIITGTRKP